MIFATFTLLITAALLFSQARSHNAQPDTPLPHQHASQTEPQLHHQFEEVIHDAGQSVQLPHASRDVTHAPHTSQSFEQNQSHSSNIEMRPLILNDPQQRKQQEQDQPQSVQPMPPPLSVNAQASSQQQNSASVPSSDNLPTSVSARDVTHENSSEIAQIPQVTVRQQPLDTIAEDEGGNGIIITLDRKESHPPARSRAQTAHSNLRTDSQKELVTQWNSSTTVSDDNLSDPRTNSSNYNASDRSVIGRNASNQTNSMVTHTDSNGDNSPVVRDSSQGELQNLQSMSSAISSSPRWKDGASFGDADSLD